MKYYDKYLNQIKNIGSPQFDRYIQLYFSKDDDYNRTVLSNGVLQLKTKNGKTTIKLTYGKHINIYNEFYNLVNDKKKYINDLNNLSVNSELLFTSDNIKTFNDIKEKMLSNQDSLDSINKILDDKNQLEISLNKQLNSLHHELYLLYEKRQKYFNNIKVVENIDLKVFRDIFLKDKIDNRKVEMLSKKFKINTKIIKYIFNWLLVCKKYIKLQNNINIESLEHKKQIKHIESVLNNFIIEEPLVEIIGDKLIKVKKSNIKNKTSEIEEAELEDPNKEEKESEDEEESEEEDEEEKELKDAEGVETVGEEAVEDVESSDGEDVEEPGDDLELNKKGGRRARSSEIDSESESDSDSESDSESDSDSGSETGSDTEVASKKGADVKIINISNSSLNDLTQSEINNLGI